jgi:hypothetical protein
MMPACCSGNGLFATVQMYDENFAENSGALLKTRIADAARQVDLNPGLLAASRFAEFEVDSCTKPKGQKVRDGISRLDCLGLLVPRSQMPAC